MSTKPNKDQSTMNVADENNRSNMEQSDTADSTEERQPGGIPAVGKAMAPLTQPVNYAIKGTSRTLNGAVGVTTNVANGLVTGTTSVLGNTASAVLPKGAFRLLHDCDNLAGLHSCCHIQAAVNR